QTRLIDDILSVSRIILGKIRLDVGEVDLSELVRTACDTLRPAAEAKHIAIYEDIPHTPSLIRGAAERLHQVIWNLLANAVKFTPASGEVRVRLVYDDADGARISVSDTGIGINPDFLPHVFEYFRQEDSTYRRNHGGL